MAFGMGIHGEPGIWNGPVKTADELAGESLDEILNACLWAQARSLCADKRTWCNQPGGNPYILSGSVHKLLKDKGITIYRTFLWANTLPAWRWPGASISICRMADEEMKQWMDMPVHTPFYTQV